MQRNEHRRWAAAVLVVLCAALAIVLSCKKAGDKAAPKADDEVVVAINFPMTGNLAYYGEVVSRGVTLAVDDYNNGRGKGAPAVRLKIEDNYGKVPEAVKVFNKVVEQDGAVAMVSLFTPHSVALLPFSAKRKVVLYATVTSVEEFGVKSPFAFRDYISLPGQGRSMAEYLKNEAKVSKVGSLVVNDDYGLDSLRLCKGQFEKLGGTWGVQEVFEQKDIDIRDPAAKVVAGEPDAIYIAGRELSLANAVRQTRELGFKGVIASNNGFDTPTVFKAVGDAGKDVVFTSSGFDPSHPGSEQQASF
ncbi:MAG: ABC transporter substrate-binding protein, partial [Myxococcota bacterium]